MSSPTTRFYQFSSSGVDPVGYRNVKTHASFIKELNASVSGAIDFGTLNLDGSLNHSQTKAVIFRVSDMAGGTRVENMRFWSPARPSLVGNVYFNFDTSQTYISGVGLTNSSGQVPTSLPSSQNVYRTDGHTALSGVSDTEVSEWIFLNFTADDTTSNKNIDASSNFRYRLTFDYI